MVWPSKGTVTNTMIGVLILGLIGNIMNLIFRIRFADRDIFVR